MTGPGTGREGGGFAWKPLFRPQFMASAEVFTGNPAAPQPPLLQCPARFPRPAREDAMTEEEWVACADPVAMLDWLREGRPGLGRKLLHFAVACARRSWRWVTEELLRRCVLTVEQWLDG